MCNLGLLHFMSFLQGYNKSRILTNVFACTFSLKHQFVFVEKCKSKTLFVQSELTAALDCTEYIIKYDENYI